MDAVIWNIAGIFFVAFGVLLFILLPFTPEEGTRDIMGFAIFFTFLGLLVLALNRITFKKGHDVKKQATNKDD